MKEGEKGQERYTAGDNFGTGWNKESLKLLLRNRRLLKKRTSGNREKHKLTKERRDSDEEWVAKEGLHSL